MEHTHVTRPINKAKIQIIKRVYPYATMLNFCVKNQKETEQFGEHDTHAVILNFEINASLFSLSICSYICVMRPLISCWFKVPASRTNALWFHTVITC